MPSAHPHGGAEEALVHLLRNQAAAQLSAVLVILLEEGELKEVFRSTGATVEVVPSGRLREPWKQVAAVLKIRRLLKRDRMDAVLGWMTKAHIYGGPAATLAGVPAIYFQMGVPDNGVVDRLSRLVPAAGGACVLGFCRARAASRVFGTVSSALRSPLMSAGFQKPTKNSPAETPPPLGVGSGANAGGNRGTAATLEGNACLRRSDGAAFLRNFQTARASSSAESIT